MKEAIQFWKDKVILPPDEFYALDYEKRVTAFTVSKLAAADELQDVYNALHTALKKGMTLYDFKKQLSHIFEQKGWTRWRIETIFRTNMQTAFQVGRYRQMAELKDLMPYWMYDAVNDSRTRPTHRALDGKVFPADHPFWKTWYPPNGFNCRCTVVPLSEYHLKRRGLKVETNDPTGTMLPDGQVLVPDVGFHTNPGEDYWGNLERIYREKQRKYFPALKEKVKKSLEETFGNIRSFKDIDRIIKERLSEEFVRGYKGIKLVSAHYFMATDSQGTIYISQRGWQKPDGTKFYPYRALKNAFKKLGKELLSFDEEYAVEALWHEIVHNKQILAPMDSYERRFMETLTQWYARRTYPELLKKLAGNASHQEAIKTDGYGYSRWVKKFDELLAKWNIPEDRLLSDLEQIIKNHPRNKYLEEVARVISELTGKDYYFVLNELALSVFTS